MKTSSRAGKLVHFYHLTQDGTTHAYNDDPDITVRCDFIPMNRQQALLAGVDLIDPHELYCPSGIDVKLNDLVEVEGDTANFYVKGIFSAPFAHRLAHTRVTIAKNV